MPEKYKTATTMKETFKKIATAAGVTVLVIGLAGAAWLVTSGALIDDSVIIKEFDGGFTVTNA